MILFLLIDSINTEKTYLYRFLHSWNETSMGLTSVLVLGLYCREEHTKRRTCDFLSLPKHFDELTMEEYYMLEMTRLRTFIVSVYHTIWNSELEYKQELLLIQFPNLSQEWLSSLRLEHYLFWSNDLCALLAKKSPPSQCNLLSGFWMQACYLLKCFSNSLQQKK